MGRNVTALKALYVALGGSADTVANVSTIDGMINAIATIATAGLPGTLPKVTTTENGKIMKVVEGNWELAADATE